MKEPVIYDKKLSELVKKSGVKQAPENFTSRIMDRIKHEPIPEAPLYRTFLPGKMLWIVALAVVLIIAVIIFLNWSPFDLNPENVDVKQFEKLLSYFQSTVGSLSKFFGFLTQSSLPLIIGIGIFVLIAIDRIIRKLTLNKSFLF